MLTALAVAACSGSSKPAAAVDPDPNVYPAKYQLVIAKYLLTELSDKEDFHGALISQPAIKPVGSNNHYIACVRFSGRTHIPDKAAIFLAGSVTQFVAATPEQCGDAQYQPFRELEAVAPG